MWDQSNIIVNLQKKISELETKLQNQIDALSVYDGETVVGKWGDQILYRKIIDIGAMPNATTKTVTTGLSGVTIRSISGAYTSTGSAAPIPNVNISDATYMVELVYLYANNEVRVKTGINLSAATGTVTLLYTKNPPATRDGDTDPDPTADDRK